LSHEREVAVSPASPRRAAAACFHRSQSKCHSKEIDNEHTRRQSFAGRSARHSDGSQTQRRYAICPARSTSCWSGPHFRDYHLLLDEQAEQIFATTDDIAERVRKIGGMTLRSIGHIGRLQRLLDNDADYVTPLDMLAELRDDNRQLVANMRETHDVCDEHGDVASASLLENWIDEAERRAWFLFEATRSGKG
jgi:DNA-binding ferritin-like protein